MPKVNKILPSTILGIYIKRYLSVTFGVFTFLPTGLLPIVVRIFSKFRWFRRFFE